MGKAKRVFRVGLVICLVFSLMVPQVWGFGGVPNRWGVDPNASGTKYSGPLTIYMRCLDYDCNNADLYFFVRLSQGSNTFAYSYLVEDVPYDRNAMVAAFHEFIENTLIEDICTATTCPTFDNGGVALKSITNETVDETASGDIPFKIMDIVIAVRE